MNRVEAVEQLAAIGWQMQALERRLCAPVVALDAFAAWRSLLVDPTTRFAELLAADDNPPPAVHPPEPARSVPPFQWQTAPAAPGLPAAPQGGRHNRTTMTHTNASVTRDDASPVVGLPPSPPASNTPAVRLVRDRSSLLSILNANVQADAPSRTPVAHTQTASPPSDHPAQPATGPDSGVGAVERRSGLQDIPFAGYLPVEESGVAQTGGDRRAVSMDRSEETVTSRHDGQLSRPGNGARQSPSGQQAPGARPVPDAPSALSDLGDGSESRNAWPALPIDSEDRMARPPSLTSAKPANGAQPLNVMSLPAAEAFHEDNLFGREIESMSPSLSNAQIDQILDALDERLELMLLRMYGL